jgi:hypothetical protein
MVSGCGSADLSDEACAISKLSLVEFAKLEAALQDSLKLCLGLLPRLS